MYQKPSKRKSVSKLIFIYSIMVVIIGVIVTLVAMFVMGYRLDINKGNVEQYAFLQYNSSPSGATVTVDGVVVGSKTPTKSSVPAGRHDIIIWRDGYESWKKTVDIKSGTLTWLNYALLVPKKLTTEVASSNEAVYSSLASPKSHYMIVQPKAETATFDLVDLSSDTTKITKLTIPNSKYSDGSVGGVAHNFKLEKWDNGERYIIIKHTYGAKVEWLSLDTQDVASTKNINRLFDIAITKLDYFGTSGNIFYSLGTDGLKRIDMSSKAAPKIITTGVTDFGVYSESNVVTYVGKDPAESNVQLVGVYRDGDEKSYTLRTSIITNGTPLLIAASRYFNQDCVAIAEGKKVDILNGSYPNASNENTTNLKSVASFSSEQMPKTLSFNPTGQYVFVQSDDYYASFDVEYQKFASSNIEGNGTVPSLKWLNDSYLWSDRNGSLMIREFDGKNGNNIGTVLAGQDVALTHNAKYIYSINKVGNAYQLQRVRMILP